MPEGQLGAVLQHDPGQDRLVQDRQEVGQPPARRQRPARTPAKSGPSRAATRTTSRADGLRNSSRSEIAADSDPERRVARGLDDVAVRLQGAAARQRLDELGEIERVAGRTLGELQQPGAGRAAGQRADELGRLLGVKLRSCTMAAGSSARRSAKRSSRLGTGRLVATSRRGSLRDGADQPTDRHDRGGVGPLDVVDDQHHRRGRAEFVDHAEQAFGGRGDDVDAVAGQRLGPQQPADRDSAPDGLAAGVERLEKRKKRERRAELVAGRPEDLAPMRRSFGHHRPDQRGLADAGLAFDEEGASAPFGQRGHPSA